MLRASREGRVKIVLSPVHFYEFGNAGDDRRQILLELVEEIEPAWAYERTDLLLSEFCYTWCEYFGDVVPKFQPVRPFGVVAAVFSDLRAEQVQNVRMKDFVTSFVPEEHRQILWTTFTEQASIIKKNHEAYRGGQFTKAVMKSVDRKHIACQFAKLAGVKEPRKLLERAEYLLGTQPLATMIDVFIFWGGVQFLRTWRVEGYFSELNHRRGGGVSANSFIDRQHAITGMPSCDYFVTDDDQLYKRCRLMESELRINLASVLRCQEFIDLLTKG